MALATADASGFPDVRMVLMKGFEEGALRLLHQRRKRQGRAARRRTSSAAVVLLLEEPAPPGARARRSSRFVSDAEADAYFQSRDRGARLGAWASTQSRPLEDRLALEKRIAEYALKYGVGEVPRPPHWRGYRLTPLSIEFWRNRPFRLHDRLVFTRDEPGQPWREVAALSLIQGCRRARRALAA